MLKKLNLLHLGLMLVLVAATSAASAELQITSENHAPCLNSRDSVAITVRGLTSPISGFHIALAMQEAEYSLLDVHAGSFMSSCQWEYLNWKDDRVTPIANSHQTGSMAGSDITAILEISGLASTSAEHVPTCLGGVGDLELARVTMLVAQSVDGHYTDCQYLPLRFYWRDCRDNILVSENGDTSFVFQTVSDAGLPGVTPPGAVFPGLGTPSLSCDTLASKQTVANLSGINGGFDIICADSLSACHRGDLNLNGVPAEMADVVVYVNFFEQGHIFPIVSPPRLPEVIAQSDVNGDGITLSVADLVYLIRKVVQDQQP